MSDNTKKVPIEEIVMDERCQARAEVNHDAVREYADAYRSAHSLGAMLPPPEVYLVSGKLYLVDGYHRVPAAITAGVGFLRVSIVGEGTIDDAIWYATGVNQAHGVRRSNEDKRRAVRMALESPIGQEQSNRVIAEHCGVGHQLVGEVRREWEAKHAAPVQVDESSTCDEPPEPPRRRGKDGKSYPAKRAPADETPSRPEPPVTDDEPLPFEPTAEEPDWMPAYGAQLDEAAKRVREARIFALRTVPEAPELTGVRQRVEDHLRKAQAALDLAKPVVCPSCIGAGCSRCRSAGWTTREAGAR